MVVIAIIVRLAAYNTSKLYAHDQSSARTRLRDTDARYKGSMGEGVIAPLINDSVDPCDRCEHVGEGVLAPLTKGLRPPTMLSALEYHLRICYEKRLCDS